MNRGQHRAPRERGGEPVPTATRPAPAQVDLAPQAPAMARLYVPAPVTVPDWGHMLDAEDFLAAYDAHLAPMIRSLVWAFYRDAAGETESEFMAAIARTR